MIAGIVLHVLVLLKADPEGMAHPFRIIARYLDFRLLYASATKTKNLNQVANKNQRAPGRSTVRAEGVSSGAVTCIKIGKHSAGERIQMLHHPAKSFSYTTAS